jgi:glyoxylase-like metal-dependent hydrolase (beta-lactamase superfamily II)
LATRHFRQFRDSTTGTFTYLVGCGATSRALVIDPVASQTLLYLGVLRELRLSLGWVLETHRHSDHPSGAEALREATGARIAAGRQSGIESADRLLADGDVLELGMETLTVIATPGHTPGCLTYCWDDRLFTGDSLLIGGCGDLEAPHANGVVLYDSVTRRLLGFPDETLVYPGHCLGGRRVSCIGEERERNPYFHGISRDRFVAVRTSGCERPQMEQQF